MENETQQKQANIHKYACILLSHKHWQQGLTLLMQL